MGQSKGKSFTQIETLLTRYGFEVKQVTIPELVETWLASYSVYWIRLAIVEALYQGRYKAVSVEHILALWKRLGHPTYHFTYEFERLITRHLFVEEVTNHHEEDHKDTLAESVPINTPVEVTPKNTVTFTPIQELLKKIVVPVSIAANNLSSKPDKKKLSHDSSIDNSKTEENEAKTPIQFTQETTTLDTDKPSRSIDQFVPPCDSSEFYTKLRAVAYQQLKENGEN